MERLTRESFIKLCVAVREGSIQDQLSRNLIEELKWVYQERDEAREAAEATKADLANLKSDLLAVIENRAYVEYK